MAKKSQMWISLFSLNQTNDFIRYLIDIIRFSVSESGYIFNRESRDMCGNLEISVLRGGH